MRWIILDFGSRELKLLMLRIDGQKMAIEDFAVAKSKSDYFKGLGFPDSTAWAAATIALNELDWLKPEEESTILSALPSAYLETRFLKFPFRSSKKIDKVIAFELESAIPFDVEEVQTRSKLLEGDGVSPFKKEALVMALAYRRDHIKTFEDELRKFQTSIPPVTSEILALSSLRQGITDQPVFGIFEAGHTKSQLLILQKAGTILGLRTFWWGGANLIQALSEDMSIDPEAAEQMLPRLSAQKPLSSKLENSIRRFATELRQTLKGFQTSGILYPKPFPLYVLGGPTRTPHIADLLEETLGSEFPTQILSYPINILAGRQIQGLDRIPDPEKALPALSVALSQMRMHRNRIPAFSETNFQFQRNLKRLKTDSFSILKKVAMLLIAPLIYAAMLVHIEDKENAVLISNLTKMLDSAGFKAKPGQTTDDLVTAMKKQVAENRRKLSELEEDSQSPLAILTNISKLVPARLKIDVKEYKVSSTLVSITAETSNADTATQILSALKQKYTKIKMGALKDCEGKKECKTFTMEIERDKST